uniref:RC175 n=3 Tax=Roseobacteraceae TaxID=2854170 RepID=Q8KW15_9RHOB|nr:RC175 [Ruegeria sp. PR1b]
MPPHSRGGLGTEHWRPDMAYDNANTYETIELFGLTEKDAQLPIPEDHVLADHIIRESFEALLGQLRGTGLEAEIEPLAHGLATILQRRKVALGKEVDRTADKIGALAKSHDGSEIAETALEEAQARFLQLREIVGAIEVMSEAAAECYEIETGHAFIPAAGSRASVRAQETGAVFEARQLLEQHDRETAEKSKVEGVPLIVSGATDWTDVDVIFNTLDKVRERIKQNRNQEIFLCHKGGKHGAEMIAARWARARGIAQARFDPRWSAHGRAAPFKCNDEMLDDKFAATGVVLFGGNGVALNLGQKAEAKGLTVMRVADPAKKASQE